MQTFRTGLFSSSGPKYFGWSKSELWFERECRGIIEPGKLEELLNPGRHKVPTVQLRSLSQFTLPRNQHFEKTTHSY